MWHGFFLIIKHWHTFAQCVLFCVSVSYCRLPPERSIYRTISGCSQWKGNDISSGNLSGSLHGHGSRGDCFVLLSSRRWPKIVCFVYLHFPSLFGHKSPPHIARSNRRPPLTTKTVCFQSCYLLLVVDFVFQTVLRGEICSVCIYKSVFESRPLSPVSPEGRKRPAERKS